MLDPRRPGRAAGLVRPGHGRWIGRSEELEEGDGPDEWGPLVNERRKGRGGLGRAEPVMADARDAVGGGRKA